MIDEMEHARYLRLLEEAYAAAERWQERTAEFARLAGVRVRRSLATIDRSRALLLRLSQDDQPPPARSALPR